MPEGIKTFFTRVHGAEPAGHLVIWTLPDKATRVFDLRAPDAIEDAARYCLTRATGADVYAAVGLQGAPPADGCRGSEPGVVSMPGVWADIDIAGPAHKSTALPRDEAEAWSLATAVGLPPSVIVRSGFGLQVYWLFKEPLLIETDAGRAVAKSLSSRFQIRLRQIAAVRGWTLDPTADLCRVLRVPDTFNRKLPGDIRQVTVEYLPGAYNPSDIEEILEGIEDPVPCHTAAPGAVDLPPARIEPILEGCPWMAHCRDDARTLPEPEWYRMLTVVARCGDAERWAHDLSRPHPKYTSRETNQKLRQASSEKVAPVTCGYVHSDLGGGKYCSTCLFRGNVNSPIAIGRLELSPEPAEPVESEPATAHEPAVPPAPEPSAPAESVAAPVAAGVTGVAAMIERFTDLGNAKRFAAKYRDRLRYCEKWSQWLAWDGMRWKEDDTLATYTLGADLIRGLYGFAKNIRDEDERKAFLQHLTKSESWRSLTAMLNLAKAEPGIAVRTTDFDRDPWLLTVQNGTLDLRTGRLRPHSQKDLITKLSPVAYDPAATCPHWLEFLDMVMKQRKSLVTFLQRAFGCCLTGITSDKAMFILYGAGGDNGKSTMVDIIQILLGDYATRTPTETFLKKKEGAIPNDVAKLKGARFVWASENERGSRLSEALIKEMTGGDKMSARFMRGEFFEFYPEFKPWLATNHKPQVRGDRALWNRLKLIPFDVTIPKDRQKPRHEVTEMFRAEFPGILNWAIQGCLEWQRDGLGVPEEVTAATREYEAEQDTFAMFLDEACVCVANARAASNALYSAYKGWAEEHGETALSHKMFASLMSERGFRKTRVTRGIVYEGIGIRTEDHYDAPQRGRAHRDKGNMGRQNDDGEVI